VNPSLLRKLPSIDVLVQRAGEKGLIEEFGREQILKTAQRVLSKIRRDVQEGESGDLSESDLAPDVLLAEIGRELEKKFSPSLHNAVNATGIIMHSGLGRALLSEAALAAINDAGRGYCTLALDLETGRRGHRDIHVSGLLCELTGAEAGTIVNNNAAATAVILNTLAKGKEAIVSRGQLVEIGGSFRLPEVMETSGAILREVGTTNKTHLRDYENAVGPTTGTILRVHHSNYRIIGFAEEPGIAELVALGRAHNVPVVDDLGSGALVDLREFGLETEPLVRESVAAGADLVCFSGDKLIGGPQSGIIVGKAEFVQRVKKNPLVRAFRCGKLTLAAMEATLRLFLNPARLREKHPVYRMLGASMDGLERRARRLKNGLQKEIAPGAEVSIENGGSEVGSGSVPAETLPTKLLAVRSGRLSPDEFGRRLRLHKPPIFTRIHDDCILFDLRTIQPNEDAVLRDAIISILKS
jgi:L-seryl-tRNA(Ser) seleniumtransferase